MEQDEINYYHVCISYEIPYNILDSEEVDVQIARDNLYEKLKNIVPEDKYERFSIKLSLHQLKDNFNYLVTYSSFFRSLKGLPMEEYVSARDVKDSIKEELESFFKTVDCDYKQVNIKNIFN